MRLEERYNRYHENLNENDQLIWRYLKSHRADCVGLSINELADACYVSPTTVSRFCKKLGLEGYSELRLAIKWQNQSENTVAPNLFKWTCQDYLLTIDYLGGLDYAPIFDLLDRPGRIFAYGTGEVQRHVAKEFKRLLIIIEVLLVKYLEQRSRR